MVFWKRYIEKVKTAISKVDFLKLEKKVKQNESDIAINKELINQAEQNITTITETVNTNSTDISNIKNQYAKKDAENTFTQTNTFNNHVQVLNDKELKVGYTNNDIKLRVYCDAGTKHMNIEAPNGDLKLKTPKGNVFIQTRDTMNMGNKRIDNLANPTGNQDAATKKYVDDKVAGVPQPDLTPYLTKTEAQADYGRLKTGLQNDWYSDNNFRKTPQSFGGVNYSKDLTTKEYVDGKLGIIKKKTYHTSLECGVGQKYDWRRIISYIEMKDKIPIQTRIEITYYVGATAQTKYLTLFGERGYALSTSGSDNKASLYDFQFAWTTQESIAVAVPEFWMLTNYTNTDQIKVRVDLYYIDR